MANILLTGGSGFVGSALLQHTAFDDAVSVGRSCPNNCRNFVYRTLDSTTDYSELLNDVDIVVHVAARAHVLEENPKGSLNIYRDINTSPTLALAKQAINAGVKQFIFISSIKVLGDKTKLNERFTHVSPLNPLDPYAISKAEAEIGLKDLTAKSKMDLVVIRPPLVYGKNVRGNFAKLLKLVPLQLPLPLKFITNKRSLVALDNLVDLIVCCLSNPKAANQTFLVSDDFDLSTSDLLAVLARTGGYKSRLIGIPNWLLKVLFRAIGKLGIYRRLSDSMQVDITFTKKQLDWAPPIPVDSAMQRCWSKHHRL